MTDFGSWVNTSLCPGTPWRRLPPPRAVEAPLLRAFTIGHQDCARHRLASNIGQVQVYGLPAGSAPAFEGGSTVRSAGHRHPRTIVGMAEWRDVERMAGSLPEAQQLIGKDGLRSWRVRDRLFVWERPLRESDRRALGDSAPDGDVLAARVPDLEAGRALIETEPGVYFTTPHFANYPAVLVQLAAIDVQELRELIVEAWSERAPKRIVERYEESLGEG